MRVYTSMCQYVHMYVLVFVCMYENLNNNKNRAWRHTGLCTHTHSHGNKIPSVESTHSQRNTQMTAVPICRYTYTDACQTTNTVYAETKKHAILLTACAFVIVNKTQTHTHTHTHTHTQAVIAFPVRMHAQHTKAAVEQECREKDLVIMDLQKLQTALQHRCTETMATNAEKTTTIITQFFFYLVFLPSFHATDSAALFRFASTSLPFFYSLVCCFLLTFFCLSRPESLKIIFSLI